MLLSIVFDKEKLEQEKIEIENNLTKSEIYSDLNKSKVLNKKLASINVKLDEANDIGNKLKNLQEFIDLSTLESDESIVVEIEKELKNLTKLVEEFYTNTLLKGKYDSYNALLKIHSGAGGTEACDWVEMLFRMYNMFATKKGFKVNLLDAVDGDGAGFKMIQMEIQGINAYGYLKGEIGVHRLVRISPFDSNKRRHTSFASVEVLPEIEEDNAVEINPNDLKIDTFRASGAGGQHVNKTDSAVRITHIPTGIVVECQDERSQLKNKERAFSILKSKLYDFYQMQKDEEYARNRRNQVGTGDRSERIRTYNYPQGRLTDHRINYTVYNLLAFLDGDLDDLIDNLKIADQKAKLENSEIED